MNGNYEVHDNYTPIVSILETFGDDQKADFFAFAGREYTVFQNAMMTKRLDKYFQNCTTALIALSKSKMDEEQAQKLVDRLLPSINRSWAIVYRKIEEMQHTGEVATANASQFTDWFYVLYMAHLCISPKEVAEETLKKTPSVQ